MYVTRPISRYRDNPDAAAEPPPEGPNSGILVVEDEAAVESATCCWGMCSDRQVYGLPFPQNRKLHVVYNTTTTTADGTGGTQTTTRTDRDDVVFVPVMDLPLSSCRYYVVRAHGKHIGKVSACSREEDKVTCCYCSSVEDVPPRPFDHRDVYQQVEVVQLPRGRGFTAEAVAPDGYPPYYLRRKGWGVHTSSSTTYELADDAQGMDSQLRHRMPDLDGGGASPIVVVIGKWYCPFMFISDGGQRLEDQVSRSMFYEMTLEQYWERIYNRDNVHLEGQSTMPEVAVSATVRRSTALLRGTEIVQEGGPQLVDGVMWFRPTASPAAEGELGLSVALWERMRWEMERGGWVSNGDKEERIERTERCEGLGTWEKFGCYVLVERFVLRRMDGSVAMTYEFRHTDKIISKWI